MFDNIPSIVTLRITSECNNSCEYCYGPDKNIKSLNLTDFKKMFRLFKSKGVRGVCLTGGEPTLSKDFKNIIKELANCNLQIFLDTSGDYFVRYKNVISKYVTMLGLPIDFFDSNHNYRNKNNLSNILNILSYYRKHKRPLIRIGTVVTKDNFKSLEKIGSLLTKYSIDIWKIYQFIPLNTNAVKNKNKLKISEKKFEKAVSGLEEKFSKHFKVLVCKTINRKGAYFFVNSDGNVFMPIYGPEVYEDRVIGNIFDDNIFQKWQMVVSRCKYKKNAESTFSYKF